MPRAEIATHQAKYTLLQLHAELAGKILDNQKEADRLRAAMQPDYVVIGGGNVDKLDELPADSRRGDNTRAFEGGFRLWRDKALIV